MSNLKAGSQKIYTPPDAAAGGLIKDLKFQSTGRNTGHCCNLTGSSKSTVNLYVPRGMVLNPPGGSWQKRATLEPTFATVGPGDFAVPLRGVCIEDPAKPAPPAGFICDGAIPTGLEALMNVQTYVGPTVDSGINSGLIPRDLMGDYTNTKETIAQWSLWSANGVPRSNFDAFFTAATAPYKMPKEEVKKKADNVWKAVNITSKALLNIAKQTTLVTNQPPTLPPTIPTQIPPIVRQRAQTLPPGLHEFLQTNIDPSWVTNLGPDPGMGNCTETLQIGDGNAMSGWASGSGYGDSSESPITMIGRDYSPPFSGTLPHPGANGLIVIFVAIAEQLPPGTQFYQGDNQTLSSARVKSVGLNASEADGHGGWRSLMLGANTIDLCPLTQLFPEEVLVTDADYGVTEAGAPPPLRPLRQYPVRLSVHCFAHLQSMSNTPVKVQLTNAAPHAWIALAFQRDYQCPFGTANPPSEHLPVPIARRIVGGEFSLPRDRLIPPTGFVPDPVRDAILAKVPFEIPAPTESPAPFVFQATALWGPNVGNATPQAVFLNPGNPPQIQSNLGPAQFFASTQDKTVAVAVSMMPTNSSSPLLGFFRGLSGTWYLAGLQFGAEPDAYATCAIAVSRTGLYPNAIPSAYIYARGNAPLYTKYPL